MIRSPFGRACASFSLVFAGVALALSARLARAQIAQKNLSDSAAASRLRVLPDSSQSSATARGAGAPTGGAVGRTTVQLPAADTVVVQLKESGGPEGRDWTPVVIALVSVAASVLATSITARQKNRELAQALSLKERELDRTLGMRLRELERAELTRQLTTFLGPLKQQLDLAFVLYGRLCQGDPERRTRDGFRTLVALLSAEEFSDNDRAIVAELVATTSHIRELIMSAEGYVEDQALLRALSMAAAHFRLLELAAAGKIKGEVTRFKSSTYPRELDGLVDAEIGRVRAKLKESART